MMLTFDNIVFNFIGDSNMRKLNFQDMSEDLWVYTKKINTLDSRRIGMDYSFNLFLKKDMSNFKAEVVNDEVGTIYNAKDFFYADYIIQAEDAVIFEFLSAELNRFKNAGLVSEVNLSDGNDE